MPLCWNQHFWDQRGSDAWPGKFYYSLELLSKLAYNICIPVYCCGLFSERVKFLAQTVGIPSWPFCWDLSWRWVVGCPLHSWGTWSFLFNHLYLVHANKYESATKYVVSYAVWVLWQQRITEIAGVVVSFDPKPIAVRFCIRNLVSFMMQKQRIKHLIAQHLYVLLTLLSAFVLPGRLEWSWRPHKLQVISCEYHVETAVKNKHFNGESDKS